MSEGIRGNGPPRAPVSPKPAAPERMGAGEVTDGRGEATPQAAAESPAKLDVFEASGAGPRPQVKQELQAITTQRQIAGVHFSDQELQKLATQLVVVFKRNPKAASRAARAKLATRAILRGSGSTKLAKLLAKLDGQEAEEMENDIASMIADSPRLGEWLDNISDEASRT